MLLVKGAKFVSSPKEVPTSLKERSSMFSRLLKERESSRSLGHPIGNENIERLVSKKYFLAVEIKGLEHLGINPQERRIC